MLRVFSVLIAATLLASGAVSAEEKLKPFIMASKASGDAAAVVAETRDKLTGAGFVVAGEYSPYAGTTILVVTSAELKAAAARSEFGSFGAVQRVSVTTVGDEVQVAYTNPVYMSHVYRMADNLSQVADALKAALGSQGHYGPDEGLTEKKLRDYHYKFLMPYFSDRLQLADHGSYEKAVKAVGAALAAGKGGVSQVYRVDIPGKEETVFGVHMTKDCSGDQYIMERVDFKPLKSAGHLPYEMVVAGGKVYALPAEFRIAINFPDLSMIGSNSFASIMCAPGAIEEALTLAAGGKSGT